MSKLKIAVQKSGRLNQDSLNLLRACGIQFPDGQTKLIAAATNFPLEILFLRDDDIPQYVEQKVADVGIIGQNVLRESGTQVREIERLGYAQCRLSLALPKEDNYKSLADFNQKRIATSYPNILSHFFAAHHIEAEIEVISGSVEIAPGIGLAEGICDIVSSGSTLRSNGLKEVHCILKSEAVLVANEKIDAGKTAILEKLLFRIKAVQNAGANKYILLNAPNEKIPDITNILPGMNSPTLLPLARPGWSSLHSVIQEDKFWDVIDKLRENGAEGILIVPIEKMIV